MSTKIRVAIAGASGRTGSPIASAILASSERFELTALVRPESVNKHKNAELAARGVSLKSVELSELSDNTIDVLRDMDVVISCMSVLQLKEEMVLITAASKAGVGRYVPSFFGPCCPPRGVSFGREMKEDILDHIKRSYLPYTAIDVGWWYQLSLPQLPSGRILSEMQYSTAQIIGDGNVASALVDNRDIGKYVVRIIADPRTLNRTVFTYGEVWTQNDVFDLLERLSEETVHREQVTKEELDKIISKDHGGIKDGDFSDMAKIGMAQTRYMLGVRGDNSPEHARYLGYMDAKELYPDVTCTSLEDYIKGLLKD